jgi:hypothetical protein
MIHIYQARPFTKELERLLNKKSLLPEDFEKFKIELKKDPKIGDLIRETGGVRKIRLKSSSKGKSGGFRICYFYYQMLENVYLLMIYPKNEQDDLSAEQKKALKEVTNEIKKTKK